MKATMASAVGAGIFRPNTTVRTDIGEPEMRSLSQALSKNIITSPTYQGLTRAIADRIPSTAKIVLIGEASHGTQEFYNQRADITKLLIQERGFHAVLCEADFPDMFRVNRFVKGYQTEVKDKDANSALNNFTRFPRWMWRNTSFQSFVNWLREYNQHIRDEGGQQASPTKKSRRSPAAEAPAGPMEQGEDGRAAGTRHQVGVYGLDVYSMHASAAAVVQALRKTHPDLAGEVEMRYRCMDKYGGDAQSYGLAVGAMHRPSCESAIAGALAEARAAACDMVRVDGELLLEEALQVEANAMVVAGAEAYYRNMFFGAARDETWNLRDSHFMEVVKLVDRHLAGLLQGREEPRMVLWAHNSHLGDARATDMSWRRKEHNVGQLVREHYGKDKCFGIGFTTNSGTVAAADDWNGCMFKKKVRPGMQGSIENINHQTSLMTGQPHYALMTGSAPVKDILQNVLLERAIGVIYRPGTERWSHYFDAHLPGQFDMLIHVDHSTALTPLDPDYDQEEERIDLPETFPEAV